RPPPLSRSKPVSIPCLPIPWPPIPWLPNPGAGVTDIALATPAVGWTRPAKWRLASRIRPVGDTPPLKSAPSVPNMDRALFMSEDHLGLDDHAAAVAEGQHVEVGSLAVGPALGGPAKFHLAGEALEACLAD